MRVIHQCNACRRQRARPYKQPDKSDLPAFCFDIKTLPFSNIGLDVAGHYILQTQKQWILLVTYLVTRAIALEVLDNLTTRTLALAYRRIVSRHVLPMFFLSDNAPQFGILHTYLQKTRTKPFTWKFIKEQAPWEGATYERLIGTVKTTLDRCLRHQLPVDDTHFQTLIAEIQGILNNCPLTFVGDNTLEPLTPNAFLKVHIVQEHDLTDNLPSKTSQVIKTLHNSWKRHQQAIAEATKIWRTEYLQFLREQPHTQRFAKVTSPILPLIGDVVILQDDHLKREKWPLAVVEELQRSADKQICSCVLHLPSGTRIIRPLQKIYPLKLNKLDQPEPRRIHTTKHPIEPDPDADKIVDISVKIYSKDSDPDDSAEK